MTIISCQLKKRKKERERKRERERERDTSKKKRKRQTATDLKFLLTSIFKSAVRVGFHRIKSLGIVGTCKFDAFVVFPLAKRLLFPSRCENALAVVYHFATFQYITRRFCTLDTLSGFFVKYIPFPTPINFMEIIPHGEVKHKLHVKLQTKIG
jgi:hypothetical protein